MRSTHFKKNLFNSKDPGPEDPTLSCSQRRLLESFLDAEVCWSILLRQGYGETGWNDGVMIRTYSS